MKSKYKVVVVLLLVFIAALVTAMLSSALLGQQHNWYNTYQIGNDVPCNKCHNNIEAEFTNMQTGAPHKSKTCGFCHRNETGVTYAVGDTPPSPISGEEAHAASIPACQQCHSHDTTDFSSVHESHKPLNESSESNAACVICHTGFDKSMDFNRPLYVEYEIRNGSGNWTVQGFEFASSHSTVINPASPGGKHTWKNASEIQCFDCHSDVESAIASGGHVPRSDTTTHMTAGAGHQGRRHNFDRGSITIESCKPCHLSDNSDFGSGYTHPAAQLDYHAATTEHCYNCHYNGTPSTTCQGKCHAVLKQNYKKHMADINHPDLLNSMFNQNFCWYQIDKVCIGCHKSGYPTTPESFADNHFKVYTEPDTTIIVTPL